MNSIHQILPDTPFFRSIYARLRIKRRTGKLLSREIVVYAEEHLDEKKVLVEQYRKRNPAAYNKLLHKAIGMIETAPEYMDGVDKNELLTDMLFCDIGYGFPPDEYVCYELRNKDYHQRDAFVSDIDRKVYIYQTNTMKGIRIFDNKWLTYQRFGEYYSREVVSISSKKDKASFDAFVAGHERFVKKEVFEAQGRGTELVYRDKISDDYFDKLIARGPHILEEVVKQSPLMSRLNASSVNTIRVITMQTTQGIEVAYTFLKVGREGSFVDNGGAGGILVGINKHTGALDTEGYDELNQKYVEHPDSHVKFESYQLPDWQNLLELSKKISAITGDVKFIGWDFAHTDNGWIVIEGNAASQLIGPQTIYKQGIKQEMLDYLSRMDLIVRDVNN